MNERNAQGSRSARRVAIAFAAVACVLAPGLLHADSGCVRVRTDAPVLLPDGGLYPEGTLTLCDSLALSPVTSLHKTYVNGRPVGLLASRRIDGAFGTEIERIEPSSVRLKVAVGSSSALRPCARPSSATSAATWPFPRTSGPVRDNAGPAREAWQGSRGCPCS